MRTASRMSPMTAALWLMQAGISPSNLLSKLWVWRYKWTLWPHNTTCLPMPNCSAWPAPIPSPSMHSPTTPALPTSAKPKLFGEYQPKRRVLSAAQTPSCHRHDGTIGTVDARKTDPGILREGCAMVNTDFAQLRHAYESGCTRPLAWRRAQLDALCRLVTDNRDAFVAAAMADLGKPAAETILMELNLVAGEASGKERFVRKAT